MFINSTYLGLSNQLVCWEMLGGRSKPQDVIFCSAAIRNCAQWTQALHFWQLMPEAFGSVAGLRGGSGFFFGLID